DESFPAETRGDLEMAAYDVWSVVQDAFGDVKPPLDLPIHCHVEAKRPITSLDDWTKPHRVLIGITTTTRDYSQFTYQLAHEFGHVMLNPRRTNGIIET